MAWKTKTSPSAKLQAVTCSGRFTRPTFPSAYCAFPKNGGSGRMRRTGQRACHPPPAALGADLVAVTGTGQIRAVSYHAICPQSREAQSSHDTFKPIQPFLWALSVPFV